MQFSTGAKIENACHVCRDQGPPGNPRNQLLEPSKNPTGFGFVRRNAMALRLELGEGLLGIEVPGSGFCAQDFGDFFMGFFIQPNGEF